MRTAFDLVERLVDRDRREEILGDLLELRPRSRIRWWWDVLSVVLRAPRIRAAGRVAAAAGALAVLTLGSPAGPPGRRVIKATDPAGTFTLAFDGRRVVAATMDGAPVPQDRIVQEDGRVLIRGGAGAGAGAQDLDIELDPDGSIRWQGRAARRSSSP